MELYKSLGFEENPFSTFSAEEERKFLDEVYIKPLFYNTLKSNVANGHSRFILGARGIGKTALIFQLKKAMEKENNFSIVIDDFTGIPQKNNSTEFLVLVIEQLITTYSITLGKNPYTIKNLNKANKEKLSFIIKEFFKTLSRTQYENLYDQASNFKTRNRFRKIWNRIFNRPINFLISGGIEVVADTVSKSLGLQSVDGDKFYKNYLPELTLEEIQKEENPEKFLQNSKALKGILEDLCFIIQASGFNNTVIFFDKIDENPRLNSSINAVSDFLDDILRDTTMLMNNSYSLVFSIWDVLKPELTNNGVRFDKIKPVDITWKPIDLKKILSRRISYFSEEEREITNIIKEEDDLEKIINLSNYSPRYLFRQLSYIYDQQAELDQSSNYISSEAIEKGQLIYSKNFDYYSIYPSKRGSKEDILKNINRLLKIGKQIIKTNDYVGVYNVSTPTAISYIKIVQKYNLVKELPETDGGAKQYEIKDPVITHLINQGVDEIRI